MSTIIAIVVAFLGALSFSAIGVTITLSAIIVIALFGLPRSNLLGFAGLNAPIAMSAMVIVGIVALFGRKGKSFPFAFVPLIAYLLVLMILGWTNVTDSTWSSFNGYVVAALAFGVGLYLANRHQESPRFDRWFIFFCFAAAVFQTLVAVLQTQGVMLFPSESTTTEFTVGRASGSFGHPGNLGKAMIFVVVLALPVTRSVDAIARRLAILTIIVCLIPVGLSVSRTNFVVMAMVLVLWALLLPRSSKLGGRLAILGIVGVVGFLFLDQFIVRLTEDPAGGARDHLAAVALKHIPDNLLIGVGPGNYIPYFGQFDALTGSGWPVHNMFLLALAELGLAGAVLLFFPSIVFSVRAIPAFRRTDERGSYSRALVLMTLAVSVVGLTSWGMLGGSLLYLWFFTLGYLARRAFGKADTSNPEVITTSAVLRTRDHLAR